MSSDEVRLALLMLGFEGMATNRKWPMCKRNPVTKLFIDYSKKTDKYWIDLHWGKPIGKWVEITTMEELEKYVLEYQEE